MHTTEQFASSQKANVQTLLELADTTLEGIERLVGLHLRTVKATLNEAEKEVLAKLATNDPASLFVPPSAAFQPLADNTAAYIRQTYDIASSMGAEVQRVLGEAATKARASFLEVCEAAAKFTPADAERGVALLTSTTRNALDGLRQAADEVAQLAKPKSADATALAAKLDERTIEPERA